MIFSVKWAAASAAYVGMLYGIARMALPALLTEPFSLMRVAGGAMIGMFFGGAMGLPLAASNLAAALIAAWITRGQPFAIQFGAFMLLSACGYWAVLNLLARSMRTIGGDSLVREGLWLQGAFVLATALLGLGMMHWFPDRGRA